MVVTVARWLDKASFAPFVPHDATLAAPLLVEAMSQCVASILQSLATTPAVWCKNLNSHSSLEPRWPVFCLHHTAFSSPCAGLETSDILGTVPQCPEDDWKCCSMSAEGGCEVESDGG